ncbi:MAG: glutathione S-transferase [endosymbiont of Galathealinum brachiosum]|uniref:Glutathione S-transferase n=1 Tax=endosymbiont of Galathealinum brachiosum TaxID=2200906 RepID=A0A370DFN8_9GAMM|nr:MAG: glutathione S-transferase [endosymbiont of Galathealinum brachiosum]
MKPVLYSFRRCPYAMRARLALQYCNIQVELREVDLKNKPAEMLHASPKATVPVLVCNDKTVIDESIDIMLWALQQNDPQNWLFCIEKQQIPDLILENDTQFKIDLDHYKYADRYPEFSALTYRQRAEVFLEQLEQILSKQKYLSSSSETLTDIALFPFVRQFAYVDIKWFESAPYPKLRNWLNNWLKSELFHSIMKKHPYWLPE